MKTADILPPRTHGSGAASLTRFLSEPHAGYTPRLTKAERATILAWMDGNCNYYGTWNWSDRATTDAILDAGNALPEVMQRAGCVRCHETKVGFDWINLQTPELSRILRAPLSTNEGFGLGWCRERKANRPWPLVKQPGAQPPDVFSPSRAPRRDSEGTPTVLFGTTTNEHYREMLALIRRARHEVLASPRVDMPGAIIHPGECRQLASVDLPDTVLQLRADVDPDGVVTLKWTSSAKWIGVTFEVHRGPHRDFATDASTRLGATPAFEFVDFTASSGEQHYALVPLSREGHRGMISRVCVNTPPLAVPPRVDGVVARSAPGEVQLEWEAPRWFGIRYEVLRAMDSDPFVKLTDRPVAAPFFTDTEPGDSSLRRYAVRAVSRRGIEGPLSPAMTARALPEPREPVFVAAFQADWDARLSGGGTLEGTPAGAAVIDGELLDLRPGGHVTFAHRPEFDLRPRLSVECWVKLEAAGDIPVIVSCGAYARAGWFLQKFGSGWRWHVGGLNCDGGSPVMGVWTHLLATFDGRRARLFQDGIEVANVGGAVNSSPWDGPLVVGQYGPEPGPKFQTHGQVSALKIHRRAIPAKDAAVLASKPPSERKEL